MTATDWLMFGCAAIFAALGSYVFILAKRQKNLERRIRQMEELNGNKGETI